MNSLRLILFFGLFQCTLNFCNAQHDSKTNTELADSLDLKGEYELSLKYRTLALQEKDHSSNYEIYIRASWHYTQSCIYETIGGQNNHKKALEYSLKAREISKKISSSFVLLKHNIANRIYHQYGYIQDWKNTLIEAQENFNILSDSLPEHHEKILYLIDDLGFISAQLGDYLNSLKYYERSLQLYTTHHKENKLDVAINFNRMANNYKALGMRKKEFQALYEADKYWNTADSIDVRYRFSSYEKLSLWYNYYGNYMLAETYLARQEQVLDSSLTIYKRTEVKDFSRRDYLRLYKNYIELNFKKKDYNRVKKYINLTKHKLKESTREFVFDVKYESQLYIYESQLPEKTSEEAITLIIKAIDLIDLYKDKFFLSSNDFKIVLFKKYNEIGLYDLARAVLNELIESSENDKVHDLFYLYTNYAEINSKNSNLIEAEALFNKAIRLFLFEQYDENKLNQITIDQLRPLFSFESIDGFVLTANFYFKRYLETDDFQYLNISHNLYLLASDIFKKLYLGDRYNEKLYKSYKSIEEGLLQTLKHNPLDKNINKVLEAIENNSSKLTWSKFLYSKQKQLLNVPDSIINQEYDLKALINHYQNALYTSGESPQIEVDTLKNRLADLNIVLKTLQGNIRTNYSNYYNRNYNTFELTKFREKLPKNKFIIKYIFSENNLYYFTISRLKIGFGRINSSKNLKDNISNYVKSLSTFNSNFIEASKPLEHLILPIIENNNLKKVTVIPDDVLSYLPFETLLLTNKNTSSKLSKYIFSYSSSLTLLNEQNNLSFDNSSLEVGVFLSSKTASNHLYPIQRKALPSVNKEANSILALFNGKLFNNTSKRVFLKEAKAFDILHLAMHSKIDNVNPDFSSLEFAEDHLLMSELYNETFNAKLAVLSACETGSGNLLKGEGIQSISRAFTYTGIPSTIMSLWKVDDEATSKIMKMFYKNLKKGQEKDNALLNAKLEYLNSTQDKALRHPYYWAGFVVFGNTSALVATNTKIYYYLAIGLFVFVLLLFRKKGQFFK